MVYDELTVIKQAIAHEYEGHEYYIALSKKWHDEYITEIFEGLADEELKHVRWLEELLSSKTDGMPKRIMKLIEEIDPPEIFDWSNVKNFRFEELKEAFEHIMALELDASKFYGEASSNATDEPTAIIFKKLADWELSHYHLIKEKYDAI